MYLGRYLGRDIDVGTSLPAKILNQNGEVVHGSTYWYLLLEEFNDEK